MKPTIQIAARLTTKDGSQETTLTFDRVVIGGWTGRDKAALQHHIDELSKIGVKAPEKTPTFYRVSVSRLTDASAIEVAGDGSSGEVEYGLIEHDGRFWVGAASDHTDRVYEQVGITVAKQLCDKPVANEFWPLSEVEAHWDKLKIRSVIVEEDREILYQEGELSGLISPRELIEQLEGEGDSLTPGTFLFGGTCGAIGGVRYSRRFEFALIDPVLNRSISHGYAIIPLPIKG